MSLVEEVGALRKVPLFSNLDDSKLKLLAFTSEWVTYKPKDVLFNEGDPGEDAFLVMEGEVEIYIETVSGPFLVASRGVGEIMGETAIVCDIPRTATVIAKNDLVVLKISKSVFMQLIEGSPAVAIAVIRELALRVNDSVRLHLQQSIK